MKQQATVGFKLLLMLAFCAVALSQTLSRLAAGQESKQQPQARQRNVVNPDIQAIIDGTSAVPSEFGADILIRIAASAQVSDRAEKMNLLMRAFELSADAQQAVKLSSTTGQADSRFGSLRRASSLDLDRMSLQSRVIDQMLPLDRVRARNLAGQIRLPTLQPLDCDDGMLYDLSLFYATVARVAQKGFTAEEKASGQELVFLMPFAQTLQSHAQVAPVTNMLLAAHLSPSDMEQLSGEFARALAQLRDDPRSFAGSQASTGAIHALIGVQGVSTPVLLTAFRQYLIDDFVDEKSILYQGLIALIPTASDRARVLASYSNFLAQSSTQVTHRIEWFFPAEHMLSQCDESHDCNEVVEAFLNSGDPTLNLYARLEQTVGILTSRDSRREN
jgi:hypothetical protein